MKIGLYSPYLDTFGGGERYLLTLASYLSTKNNVEIFWADQTIKAQLSRFLKIDLNRTKFVKNILNQNYIQKAISTRSYDLIFILSDGSVPFTLASKNILHFQVPFRFKNVSFATKTKLSRYNHVICNSHFTKKFIDISFQINSKVIYPPVDVKSIAPGSKEKIILSVGRFSASQLHPKKQEVLIEVFKEVYKRDTTWRLYLVGQVKKEDQKYLRHLKKSAQGHAIKIIENQAVDELRKLYAKTSIYWHATGFGEDENKFPERMEHFGISTVEAQAAGAVPVVIDKGGQKEIVRENIDGLLFNTKTELFEKTLGLIKNDDRLSKLSTGAIKNSKRFSKENFLKEYEKIIY